MQFNRCIGENQFRALRDANAFVDVGRFERARRHQHFAVGRQTNLGLRGRRHRAAPRRWIGPQLQTRLFVRTRVTRIGVERGRGVPVVGALGVRGERRVLHAADRRRRWCAVERVRVGVGRRARRRSTRRARWRRRHGRRGCGWRTRGGWCGGGRRRGRWTCRRRPWCRRTCGSACGSAGGGACGCGRRAGWRWGFDHVELDGQFAVEIDV
mmetsp:Transcript_5288/g.8744  ORF Transcript_5288/g.8744 Transcript_5288/m.8744 type:complete len:211 (+) Transcript_5288:2512-3144(+)